jgi:hypothetical protein
MSPCCNGGIESQFRQNPKKQPEHPHMSADNHSSTTRASALGPDLNMAMRGAVLVISVDQTGLSSRADNAPSLSLSYREVKRAREKLGIKLTPRMPDGALSSLLTSRPTRDLRADVALDMLVRTSCTSAVKLGRCRCLANDLCPAVVGRCNCVSNNKSSSPPNSPPCSNRQCHKSAIAT